VSALAIAALFGLALLLTLLSVRNIFAEVPQEDRTYLDRPPPGFRAVWPLVRLIVHYLGPRLSVEFRLKRHARLKRAGVDFALSPEQFLAGKLIAAAGFTLIMVYCQVLLEASSWQLVVFAGLAGFFYPDLWLREATRARQRLILKQLPFFLDIVTLSVEAGTNLSGAFNQAFQKGPAGPLRAELGRVLRDMRAGKSRADALRTLAERLDQPAITNLVGTLIQAESMGTSLGPVLRAQSEQRRTERFQRAEKLAMEAPVKLLAPLMAFIFPNTFLILIFVLVVKAVQDGVLAWPWLVYLLR